MKMIKLMESEIFNRPNLPLVSIIMAGRNDSHMGNYEWRLATSLKKTTLNILKLGFENKIEIILVDWGSERPLINILDLPDETKQLLKIIQVTPDIAAKYNLNSHFSSSHAFNTGFLRAKGEYILFTDSDSFFPLITMQGIFNSFETGILKDIPLKTNFFWASRYHIPKEFQASIPSLNEIEDFILKQGTELNHSKINKENFKGSAGALIITKEILHNIRGFDEKLIYYGWNDIDLHLRLLFKYTLGGDIEDFGLPLFHLEHYTSSDAKIQSLENPNKKSNPHILPTTFAPNPESWGLKEEKLDTFIFV